MDQQQDEQALQGIIQMLLALAVLAERASGAALPVRCLVLWILRPAEAFAQDYVCEVAQTPLHCIIDPAFLDDDGSSSAIRLAMRFRALAAVLEYLLGQPQRFAAEIRRLAALFAHWNAGAPKLAPIMAAVAPAATAARRNRPNDTS